MKREPGSRALRDERMDFNDNRKFNFNMRRSRSQRRPFIQPGGDSRRKIRSNSEISRPIKSNLTPSSSNLNTPRHKEMPKLSCPSFQHPKISNVNNLEK